MSPAFIKPPPPIIPPTPHLFSLIGLDDIELKNSLKKLTLLHSMSLVVNKSNLPMQTFLRNLKYCTNLSVSTVCALPGYQNNFRLSLSNLRKTLKTCIIPFTVRKDFPMSTHLVRMNSDNEMHLPPSLQYIAGSFYPSVIQFHKMLARVANLRVLSLTMSNQEFGKCL